MILGYFRDLSSLCPHLIRTRIRGAGEGGGNTDRTDVCPDDRGPVSVPEESRGRLFSGVTTWPQELREVRTAEGHQQSRRPVSANDDGAGSALHPGAFWRRQ